MKEPGLFSISLPARRGPRRWLITGLVIAAVLLVARLLAPICLQRAVNQRLARIPAYGGHVGHIGLALWRGGYQLNDLEIVKRNGSVREPFFRAKKIDFSIAWREIFHGRLVSDIYVTDAELIFVRGPDEASSQLTADRRWQDVINDLFPIDITHLVIEGGTLRYIDATRTPRADFGIRDLKVVAAGLRNRPSRKEEIFPASIALSGRTVGNGDLQLYARLEPLADQAHFRLAIQLKRVSLPAMNDLLRAYAGFDVSRGQFELFGQMAMQRGHYEGYIKPFLERVDFRTVDDDKKDLVQRVRKDLMIVVAALFKNKDTKQLATRIPFTGDTKSMDVGMWRTILNGLHHGFIKALPQTFEGTTHPDGKKSNLPPVAPTPPKPSAP